MPPITARTVFRICMGPLSSVMQFLFSRQRLQHPDPFAFAVVERHVASDARDVHRLAEHLAAAPGHALHRGMNIVDRNDHARVLPGPVRLAGEEPAVDGSWRLRTSR